MTKAELAQLNTEIEKLKFHNSCLLYLIGELRDAKKLKSPTMQEVCVLFDLLNDELKIILKNIQSFYGDLDKFTQNLLDELNRDIGIDGLFFIIKGIKNSTSGKVKKICKILSKQYQKSKKQ